MKTPKPKPVAKTSGPRPARAPRKIFIVEDHPVFREGVKQLVNGEGDLTVCGEAADYEHALEAIARTQPDLALVDISLPGRSGLELIKKLRAENHSLKLLVVSMHDEALYADRVLRAGGDGYIMKQEDPSELIHAIRDLLGGHIYVSEAVLNSGGKMAVLKPATTTPIGRGVDQLTDAELEILELLGQGKSNLEIAHELSLSLRMASGVVTQIRRKLKLKSMNALVRYAVCWVESAAA